MSILPFHQPRVAARGAGVHPPGREDPYEVTFRHKDGRTILVEAVGKTMPELHGDYRIVILRDITARKAQEREAFLALHDTLTELPNRRHLMDRLDTVIADAGSARAVLPCCLSTWTISRP